MDKVALIKKHEGLRLRPYKCSAGKLTIGYGRNIEDIGITDEEAEYLLMNDISRVEQELFSNFEWFEGLPSQAQSVMVNMCFNLGIARLKGFRKFLAAMEAGAWQNAAREMMDSRWANQVPVRARELRDIVLSLN